LYSYVISYPSILLFSALAQELGGREAGLLAEDAVEVGAADAAAVGDALVAPAGASIGACRAYFKISDGTPVRAFNLNFGDDTETGIGSINGLTPDPSLLRRGEIYNISGQRLSKPQKGINIINGKKVVIK